MLIRTTKLVALMLLVGVFALAALGQSPAAAELAPGVLGNAPSIALDSSAAVTGTVTITPTATVTPTATAVPQTATSTKVANTPTVTPTKALPTATKTVTPTVATATATKTVTPTVATATATKTATKTATPVARLGPRAAAAGVVQPLSTGFRVQNLDPAVTATLTAQFINDSGSTVNSITRSIGPSLSTVIDQRVAGGGLDCGALCSSPWNGSVILSSNTQIASVVQEFSPSSAAVGTEFRSDAYNALSPSDASLSVLLPQILKGVIDPLRGNKEYNSYIAIQNTDLDPTHTATIYVTYNVPGVGTFQRGPVFLTAGTSYFIDMKLDTTIPPSAIPYGFNGSGTVVSNRPVVVVANQNAVGTLMGYTGFTDNDAATTLTVPFLLKGVGDSNNGYTWASALFLMAQDPSTPTTVDITYRDKYTQQSWTDTKTFQPSILIDLTDPNQTAFANKSIIYASAVVTARNSKKIVAMVTQQTNVDSRGSRSLSYRCFPSSAGTASAFVPTVLKGVLDPDSGARWSTALILQWQGANPTSVTLTYTNVWNNNQTISQQISLGPSNPMVVVDQAADPLLTGANATLYGSAVLTSNPPEPFVVLVNQLGNYNSIGDSAMSFRGINK